MLSPKGEFILVKGMKEEAVTKGGIIIPERVREKLNMGTIIEGATPDLLPLHGLKVGEIVIFPHHCEYRFTHEKEDYILVRASDIIGGDNCNSAIDDHPELPLEPEKKEPETRRKPLGLNPQEKF